MINFIIELIKLQETIEETLNNNCPTDNANGGEGIKIKKEFKRHTHNNMTQSHAYHNQNHYRLNTPYHQEMKNYF